MGIKQRRYNFEKDFNHVGDFLVENYQTDNRDGNFFFPTWSYMHYHPYLDRKILDNAAVWEDNGKIFGVVHQESRPEEAFFELHPDYPRLKQPMLDYAVKHFHGKSPDGKENIRAFINDFDKEFEELAIKRGFQLISEDRLHRPMSQLTLPQPSPKLPDGFRLQSLADEDDLVKLDRCIYRGFNHGPEPPETDFAGRKLMQSAPGFCKELNIVVVAPDDDYVAYAGLWFEEKNKFAYVEPVCTDPDYRLRGLAKAAILEGIRRCGKLGAKVAYVGSTLPIYLAMGFKKLHTCRCWVKYLD